MRDPNNYKMRVEHLPENGQYGDCYRCAVAFVLGMEVEDVPHFMSEGEAKSIEDTWKEIDDWLALLHLALVHLPFDGSPSDVIHTFGRLSDGPFYYIVGGISPRGSQHVIVCSKGEMVLDPAPGGGGLTDVCSNGRTWVNLIVPRALTNGDKEV